MTVQKNKHQSWLETGRRGTAPAQTAELKKLLDKLTGQRQALVPPDDTAILAAVIPLSFSMLNHFADI